MKIKQALPIAAFFVVTSASASGGLSINDAEQSMNADNWVSTHTVQTEVYGQGPIDAFNNYVDQEREVVETDSFRQDYDGQA